VNELIEIDGVEAVEELLVDVLDELLDELDGADDFELLDELLPQAATATLAVTASAALSALLLSRCTRNTSLSNYLCGAPERAVAARSPSAMPL
jgi:hypothetical protein